MKTYITPDMTVFTLSQNDVITTSGEGGDCYLNDIFDPIQSQS